MTTDQQNASLGETYSDLVKRLDEGTFRIMFFLSIPNMSKIGILKPPHDLRRKNKLMKVD